MAYAKGYLGEPVRLVYLDDTTRRAVNPEFGRRRRFGQALHFGQNLIPDSTGLIRVGDPVEIR